MKFMLGQGRSGGHKFINTKRRSKRGQIDIATFSRDFLGDEDNNPNDL